MQGAEEEAEGEEVFQKNLKCSIQSEFPIFILYISDVEHTAHWYNKYFNTQSTHYIPFYDQPPSLKN